MRIRVDGAPQWAQRAALLVRTLREQGHEVVSGAATDNVRPTRGLDRHVAVGIAPPFEVEATFKVAWSQTVDWPPVPCGWDLVVALSPIHAAHLEARLAGVPIVTIPLPAPPARPRSLGVGDRLLYASPTSRGLLRLLEVWPRLWGAFRLPLAVVGDPKGELRRCGGLQGPVRRRLLETVALLDQPGVVLHDGPEAETLDHLLPRSRALLYPLDPLAEDPELDAWAVWEACVAGLPLVLARMEPLHSEFAECAHLVTEGGDRAPAWEAAVASALADKEGLSERGRLMAALRTEAAFGASWQVALREAPPRPRPPPESWLILASGIGHGEAALAALVCEAAHRRGVRIRVLCDAPSQAPVLAGPWPVVISPGWVDLPGCLLGVDQVVASDAWMCAAPLRVIGSMPGRPAVVSLEHNWPEGLEAHPAFAALDRILVALPQRAWASGAGGREPIFGVDPVVHSRVQCVGWLPHPIAREGRPDVDHARILLYSGAQPSPYFCAAAQGFFTGLAALLALRPIECLHVGAAGRLQVPGWVRRAGPMTRSEFGSLVASSALVVAHPAATTLAQCRAAGVPFLGLASGLLFEGSDRAPGDRYLHALHLAGEAEMVIGDRPAAEFERRLRELLSPNSLGVPSPDAGGAERAVDLVQAVAAPADAPRWNPPVLRP